MATNGEVQGEYDDSQLPGPGAPTPLSALEVSAPLKWDDAIMSTVKLLGDILTIRIVRELLD